MTTELTIPKPSDIQVGGSKYADRDALSTVTGGKQFLPYVQLHGSSSTVCKEGKFPMGHFALTKGKELTDLGDSFLAVPLSWRPRAMEFGDSMTSVYDYKSEEFLRIKKLADTPGITGYAYGMEFLLYLPDFDTPCVYLFGNESARNESPNLLAIHDKQKDDYIIAKIYSELVGKKYRWHVPVVKETDNKLTSFLAPEVFQSVLNNFNNPVESAVETVAADTRER